MHHLAAVYDITLTEERIDSYYEVLGGREMESIARGIKYMLSERKSKKFPMPAEIKDWINDAPRPPERKVHKIEDQRPQAERFRRGALIMRWGEIRRARGQTIEGAEADKDRGAFIDFYWDSALRTMPIEKVVEIRDRLNWQSKKGAPNEK